MPPHQPPEPVEIATAFAIGSAVAAIEPLGKGLINDTYRVATRIGDFVLQRINPLVFPDPELIMANLAILTEHATRRPEVGLRLPALVASRQGRPFVRAADGALWRLMEFIPDALALAAIEQPAQAQGVGTALGRFHRLTQDLPPARLGYSLPGFHRTLDYLTRYLNLRTQADSDSFGGPWETDEAGALEACHDFIDARRDLAQVLDSALADGRLRERIVHGDPKLDNILFHREDGRVLALIDLDTVQPGLIQHDLGDCLRSCCNRLGESPEGPVQPRFDLDLCGHILGAYAAETRDLLDPADLDLLYDGIRLMPFELGLRFLTDHLEGDRYFRVGQRGENLRKARLQLALVADIESKEEAIRRLIATAYPA